MSTIKLLAGVANTSAITTGLDSLADAARAISAAIDNTTNLDLFMDLLLKVKYTTSAPTAGVVVADVYLIPSIDGTNYSEGSGSITPQGAHYVGSFETRNGSTSAFEFLALERIPLGPYNYKLLIVNRSGKTLASSGNILSYSTWKSQVV